MGSGMATIDMGRKEGGLLCPFRGQLGSHLTQCGLGRGLPHTNWHLDPFSRLTTTDMDRKVGGVFYAVPFIGELDPHLTQCRLDRGLYLRTKWHLHPSSRLATTDMGQKLGGLCPFWGEAAGFPSKTICGLGRDLPPCEVSSWSIQPFGLIEMGQKWGVLCPFWGRSRVPI